MEILLYFRLVCATPHVLLAGWSNKDRGVALTSTTLGGADGDFALL